MAPQGDSPVNARAEVHRDRSGAAPMERVGSEATTSGLVLVAARAAPCSVNERRPGAHRGQLSGAPSRGTDVDRRAWA